MKAGSRPHNQTRCLEGAPIKPMLQESVFQNISVLVCARCNWFPPSHLTAVFGSLYSTFCCSALWCFWCFEILLKLAENLTEAFVLLLFQGCDMCTGESVSCCVTTVKGANNYPSRSNQTYYDALVAWIKEPTLCTELIIHLVENWMRSASF